ncbi:MAG: transcriptional repressor LexA [Bacillota bacterium]|nr:transcriptional repressor LexA [Bacillota bacterium]
MRSKNKELMREIKEFVENYYMVEYRSPSTTEIARNVGIARGTAYKYLVEMRERGMLSYDGKEIRTELTEKVMPNTNNAAILGSVSCGVPKFAEENIEEYIPLPETLFGKGDFFILKANGTSMIDAGIDDGDLVVIRQQSSAEEGQIVVALIDDEATLKRFYRDDRNKCIRLHPENSNMDDIIVDDCIIQGIAVKVIKDIL